MTGTVAMSELQTSTATNQDSEALARLTRWATPEDSSELARLAGESGNTLEGFDLDWSDPGHTWLVVDGGEDGLLGAIQILAAKPAGRMEVLMLPEKLSKRARFQVSRALIYAGMAILRAAGSQLATATVSIYREDSFVQWLEKHGCVCVDQSHIIVKRLI